MAASAAPTAMAQTPLDYFFGRPGPRYYQALPRRRGPGRPQQADVPLPVPRPHFPGDSPAPTEVAAPALKPALPEPAAPDTSSPKPKALITEKPPAPPITEKAAAASPSTGPVAPAAPSSVKPEPAPPAAGVPLPPEKPADLGKSGAGGPDVLKPAEVAKPDKTQPEASAPADAAKAEPKATERPSTETLPSEAPAKNTGAVPVDVPPPAGAVAPVPPPKPPELAAPAGPATPASPNVAPSGARLGEAPGQPLDDAACPGRLAAHHVDAAPTDVGPQPDPRCTVVQAVRLVEMTLPDGAKVSFPDKPTIACTTAETFSTYVRDLLSPLARGTFGAPLTAVWTGPGLECRSRDHIFGAKLSAHGQGLAIDIAQLKLGDGRTIDVGTPKTDLDQGFETAARAAACGYFHTVLGPGSDAYHRTHWHFDLEVRGAHGDSKYCK